MRFLPAFLFFASSLGAQETSRFDAMSVDSTRDTVLVVSPTAFDSVVAALDTGVAAPRSLVDTAVAAPRSLTVPLDVDRRLFVAPIAKPRTVQLSGIRSAPRKHRGRYGGGFIGFVAGAAVGVGVAAAGGPYHCSCDDPGLDQAVIGIAIGGVLGAGIGAALPGSEVPSCTRGARIGQGIFGSLAGTALGVGLGALVDPLAAVLVVPFTAPLGASGFLRHCN